MKARARLNSDSFACSLCGQKFRSNRGRNLHFVRSHTFDSFGERNWAICYMFFREEYTVWEIMQATDLSASSINRILSKYIQFPRAYDLAEGEPTSFIPIFSHSIKEIRA